MVLSDYFRDRASHNDVIGTAHLCISKISAPGGEIEGEFKKIQPKNQFNWVCFSVEFIHVHGTGLFALVLSSAYINEVA